MLQVLRAPGRRLALLFALITATPGSAALAAGQETAPPLPLEDCMSGLQAKYGQNAKKYEALAKRIDKAVRKALEEGTWTGAGGQARPLTEHPYLRLVDELSTAARGAARKKNSAFVKELLTKYPWDSDLQLVLGLQHGSDRATPDHDAGFIHLGLAEGTPGFPDVTVNQYLFGLRELVSWQYAVQSGKKLAFDGRGPKNGPTLASSVPGWERIRIYLQGAVPDVSLYAIPWMTHAIHGRLAERRAQETGVEDRMDETLALLDSKWNGFTFELPYDKERIAIAQPVHAVFTERNGFIYQFPPSEHLANTGDIPFVSVTTYGHYADVFRGERLGPADFVQKTAAATACVEQFTADSAYLARYKKLIAEFVFAVLTPSSPYPSYMGYLDYPAGTTPSSRERRGELDTPRKHAILVWAHCGKDPAKVADYLYDNLVGKEANRFPADVVLPNELTRLVRADEAALLASIVEQVAADRGEAGPGELEREFSPHANYLDAGSETASDFVLHSFHVFHAAATDAVREAAYAVVAKELGK